MNKKEVTNYFDSLAPHWDECLVHNDEIINLILDNAGVAPGKNVLDVACGTGVLIGDYLKRQVLSITAVDIAPQMAKIAQRKFPQENVHILCDDIECIKLNKHFECIMVYNAFPHFPNPRGLIKTLTSYLKPGGTLTVAHGMSREALTKHHSGDASRVSVGLMSADELSEVFSEYLNVTVKISDEKMYQVTGMLSQSQ